MDEEQAATRALKLIRAIVDGFLAVGEFGEAGVDFVDLVAVDRVAEFFETVGEGATAGVFAESAA
jgi:hypothetical protein